MKQKIYKTFSDLIAHLTERQIDIIKRKFGIGYPPQSLGEIGSVYSLSRERVRQLKERALLKILRKAEENKFLNQEFIEILKEILKKLPVKTEKYVLENFQSIFSLDEREKELIRFFIFLHKKIFYHQETKELRAFLTMEKEALKKTLFLIKNLHKKIKSTKNIWPEESFINFLEKEIETHFNLTPEREEIFDFMRILKGIGKNPLNEIGSLNHERISPSSLIKKIKMLLEFEKKSLHFVDIHQKLKEIVSAEIDLLSDKWQKIYSLRSVHNTLLSDPDFVRVGQGKYALRQWGYQGDDILELMKKIVTRFPQISKDKLYELLKKEKEFCDNTFQVYLNKYFKLDKNKVTLK